MENRIIDFYVGQSFTKRFHVEEEMGAKFAALSQDFNPVHLDEEFANKTQFKGKIAHGMLVASFISGVIGNDFPGNGSIYMKQDLKFLAPVRYGDDIDVCIEIKDIIIEKSRMVLLTTCTNQNGKIVIGGEATIMLKDN